MEQLAKLNAFYGKNRYVVNGLLAIGGVVILYYIAKGAIRVATRGSGFSAGEQESNEQNCKCFPHTLRYTVLRLL